MEGSVITPTGESSSLLRCHPGGQTWALALTPGVEGRTAPEGGEAQICHLPLADSFLVLMILAAYSWPASTFTHLRTTEKAPLEGQRRQKG